MPRIRFWWVPPSLTQGSDKRESLMVVRMLGPREPERQHPASFAERRGSGCGVHGVGSAGGRRSRRPRGARGIGSPWRSAVRQRGKGAVMEKHDASRLATGSPRACRPLSSPGEGGNCSSKWGWMAYRVARLGPRPWTSSASGSPNSVWTPAANMVGTSGAPVTGSPAARTS